MKPKRLRGIGKAAPSVLPHVVRKGRGTGQTAPASVPTLTPSTQPIAPVQPNQPVKSGIQSPTGWKVISAPSIYPLWPSVLFTYFRSTHYVRLRSSDPLLRDLRDEMIVLGSDPKRKIVFDMPPEWLSHELNHELLNLDKILKLGGGKLVLYYPTWHGQASTMQSLVGLFPIPITNDRDQAAKIVLGQAQQQVAPFGQKATGSGSGGIVWNIPSGSQANKP